MGEIRGNERSPFYANNHRSTLHQTIVAHNLWIFWILDYIELHIFHYLDFSKLALIKRLFQNFFYFRFLCRAGTRMPAGPKRESELTGFIGDQILTCNPLRTEWFESVSRLEPELDDSRHQHQPLGMKQKRWEVMGCV